jgi:ribosomal 50S subunit-recycling heat shock protein
MAEKRGVMGERCSRAVKIGDQLTLNSENQETVLHVRNILKVFRLRRRRTPEDAREMIKLIKTIKRRAAASVNIELIGSQLPMERITAQFKPGPDLEP